MTKKNKQKAIAVMKFNKAKECFVTDDGQVFLNENRAKFHAKNKKLKYEPLKLNDADKEDSEEAPLDDTDKNNDSKDKSGKK